MTFPAHLGLLPRAAADRFSDRLALIDSTDVTRNLSYSMFADRCDRIAQGLIFTGLPPGARIMVIGYNQPNFLEAVFSILRADMIAVPVDERLGVSTIRAICANCSPSAVIVVGDQSILAALRNQPLRISIAEAPDWMMYEALANVGKICAPVRATPDEHAIIMHTSGSTGLPKSVKLTHAAATAGLRRNFPAGAAHKINDIRQRSLIALPLGHEAAFSAAKYMLAYGGTIVLNQPFRAALFLRSLAEHHCTHTLLVPAMASMLLKEPLLLQSLNLSALQSIVIGSAPCPPELLRALTEAFPVSVVTQNYGLTECGQVFAQSYTRKGHVPFVSLGRPVPGVEVRLEGGNDAGELYVKTKTMASSAVGWYKTGDLFRRDASGFYYFQGRKDDMISCGGMNIFPLEVERILTQHPSVAAACVVALSDQIKGQVPAAIIVPRPGAALTREDIADFYLLHGAAYARPRQIRFVTELPLSTTGKIDRRAARAMLEQVAPEAAINIGQAQSNS